MSNPSTRGTLSGSSLGVLSFHCGLEADAFLLQGPVPSPHSVVLVDDDPGGLVLNDEAGILESPWPWADLARAGHMCTPAAAFVDTEVLS